jgi:uncharacterized protein
MTRRIFRPVFVSLSLLILSFPAAGAPVLPEYTGMLNDFAGKLSAGTRSQLEDVLRRFRDASKIEVAVVTVNFDDMQGYPIEQYALELGRKWGVGRDAQKKALLLLVAIKPPEADGKYHGGTRLEVSRQLEGDIPDILAGELIRKMRDDFQGGRFDQALTSGTQTILATLQQRLGLSVDGVDQTQAARQPVRRPRNESQRRRSTGVGGGLVLLGLLVVVGAVVFVIIRKGGGGPGGRGGRGGWGNRWEGGSADLLPLIILGMLSGRGSSHSGWGEGSSGGWGGDSGGGFGGGGDSGGGFGGFGGGGDFGGGGASDSW